MGRREAGPRALSRLVRGARVDREGMDAAWHQRVQSIIYEAMPGDAAEAFEAGAGDAHAEMPTLSGTGVAGVQVAVVLDLELSRRQRLSKGDLDVSGADAHGVPDRGDSTSSSASGWRDSQKPCATRNTSIRPVSPNTLKLAHVEVE